MKMKIKHQSSNSYVINGMKVLAINYKDAMTHYLSVHSSGARPIFADKG